MTSNNPVTDDDQPQVVLEHQSGIDSLRKLVQGFCGFKQQQQARDSQSDLGKAAEGTVASEDEVTPEPKEEEPQAREITISNPTPTEVCTESVETADCDVSALGEKPASDNEKAESKEIDHEQEEPISTEVVSDDSAGEGVEVVSRELVMEEKPEVKEEAESSTAAEGANATTTEKGRSSVCMVMAGILCWILLVVGITNPALVLENSDFQQLDFSQQGLKDFGLKVQQMIEKELAQSTSKLLNINEVVQETVDDAVAKETIDVTISEDAEEEVESTGTTVGDEPVVNDASEIEDENVEVVEKVDSPEESESLVEENSESIDEDKKDDSPEKDEGEGDNEIEQSSEYTEEVDKGHLREYIEHLTDVDGAEAEEEPVVNKEKDAEEGSKTVPLAFVHVPSSKAGEVVSETKEEL